MTGRSWPFRFTECRDCLGTGLMVQAVAMMLSCLDAESIALLLSSMDQARIQQILSHAPPAVAAGVLGVLALMGDKSGAPAVSLAHRCERK
eukprot:8377921-Pyramimonas_sp.AAC.2